MLNPEYERVWKGEDGLESKMIEMEANVMYDVVALVKNGTWVGDFHLDEGDGKDVSYRLNPERKPLFEPIPRLQIKLMGLDQTQKRIRLVRAEDHENYGK